MKRLYVDSNVYLDYLEARSNGLRPLQEFAFNVFKRAISCEFEIVLSSEVLRELNKHGIEEKKLFLWLDELFSRKKIFRAKAEIEDLAEAKNYPNFSDALHAVIAKRTGCEFIVTRDAHFSQFRELVKPCLPEEL